LTISHENKQKLNIFLSYSIKKILAEESRFGTWNYYSRKTKLALPDDLDTTFTSILALLKNNIKKSNSISKIVNVLINCEIKPGGPYNTWIGVGKTNERDWKNIDPTVNALIGAVLNNFNIELKNLTSNFNNNCIREFKSKFYLNDSITYYWLSMWWKPPVKLRQKIYNYLTERVERKNSSAFDVTQAISALANFQMLSDKKIDFLITKILSYKTTNLEKYCIEIVKNDKTINYFSSNLLREAWVIHSLNILLNLKKINIPVISINDLEKVAKCTLTWVKKTPPNLRPYIESAVFRLIKNDKANEITYFAKENSESIIHKNDKRISQSNWNKIKKSLARIS